MGVIAGYRDALKIVDLPAIFPSAPTLDREAATPPVVASSTVPFQLVRYSVPITSPVSMSTRTSFSPDAGLRISTT
jgi:hypothetical protein